MENSNNKGVNPMAAGLTGMIIGAGMGAVSAWVLSDKKTRGMLAGKMNEAKEKVLSYAHDIRIRAGKAKESAEHRIIKKN